MEMYLWWLEEQKYNLLIFTENLPLKEWIDLKTAHSNDFKLRTAQHQVPKNTPVKFETDQMNDY